MEGTIAEIRMFAGNFAPRNWNFCQGQLIPISQNQALFSIIGTTYGGDGRTTCALPDLRGRTVIGPGRGPGLPPYSQGNVGGIDVTTLNISNMPEHDHSASTTTTTITAIKGSSLAGAPLYENTTAPTRSLNAGTGVSTSQSETTISQTGKGQPFSNMQPYLPCYYIICVDGTYPART
jgi:microcystin-dependent protein